jgi:uncharacterized membrane protein YedE/YeeE
MLEKIFHETWPWWVSGPLVGLYVLAFLFIKDRPLGASSAFQALMEALRGKGGADDFGSLNSKVALPVDPRDPAPRWRVWWLGGVFLGGLTAWACGGEATGGALLPGLAEFFKMGTPGLLALLFVGGLFIGAGTRMSGGCTSGHAITGISNLQLPSIYATLTFFAVGMAFSFAMRALIS